jgi:enoyl-CoA hydratase
MSDPSSTAEPEVLIERRGAAGTIVLNRPKALNAVTLGMVRAIAKALDAWEHDARVTRVVVTGAGEKAFCAGGDIRRLHDLGTAGEHGEALAFWREEYVLNARIKRYPKPYVALVDGIVMGGGVGLSLHGSHLVAGERFLLAMPEVGIGFFPDVGATYALPRLPGRTGLWLALTGARIRRADAVTLRLASHAVASVAVPTLVEALCTGESVEAALARFAVETQAAPSLADRPVIDRAFAGASVIDILSRLDGEAAEGSAFAAQAAAAIRTKSPNSLAIAFEQMRQGAALTFEQAMDLEFKIVSRMIDTPDFYEGVRALVIDKDQAPRWDPASLEAVDPRATARYFAPLPSHELGLSGAAS